MNKLKKVSKDLLEWVDKGYQIITLTASCGLMLKFEWPLLLPNDENIKKLSKNVSDIDEYIVDIAQNEGLAEGLQEIDGGVTVHNACHARAQNMGIKARDMLKFIPNIKMDIVERCAGHGGTFGVMKETHDLAVKVGTPTAKQIKNKNNKYMASDCPLAGKHLKQLETDTNITNDEALHPIELMAKSYKTLIMTKEKKQIEKKDLIATKFIKNRKQIRKELIEFKKDRRIALGPYATFYFESFETMLAQVQEMLHIEKGGDEQLKDELIAYNPLVPNGKELTATLMFEIDNPVSRAAFLGKVGGIEEKIFMKIDNEVIKATRKRC